MLELVAAALGGVSCDAPPGHNCQVRLPPTAFDEASLDRYYDELRAYGREKRQALLAEFPEGFGAYDRPDLAAARSNFVQPQVMLHDRFIYDRERGEWTVGRFLEDLTERYGGVDSVLLWHGYTNLGVDDRNQFDLLRSAPGGIEGMARAVADFQGKNVAVFVPYFIWDGTVRGGTRNEGAPDYAAMVGLASALGADGVNGDTCDGLNATWFDESLRRGKALILESQSMGSERDGYPEGWENITHAVSSWAENWKYTDAPLVSAYRLIEPRHMVHVVERFATNRTDGLHHAFFNGVGYETWESIWGQYNVITPRDGEAIRRVAAILRQFADVVGEAEEWRPYEPGSAHEGLFISRFSKGRTNLYLMVNRRPVARHGLAATLPCRAPGRFWDVYYGVALEAAQCDVHLSIEALGFAAVLEDDIGPPAEYLRAMRSMTARNLADYSTEREILQQTMTPMEPTAPPEAPPEGMVPVTLKEDPYPFLCRGILPQGKQIPDIADVQFPWEATPRQDHLQLLELGDFYMDRHLVTNADYKSFLDATGWQPPAHDRDNWLRHWSAGTFPEGGGAKPIVWVSRDDAVAFCSHHGKRLPRSWEWQVAAQGADGANRYPWGDARDPSLVPPRSTGRVFPTLEDVGLRPGGASPFGVEDLLGNVYQWTDEFLDAHTAKHVVRGSSCWDPRAASRYYFAEPADLFEHNTIIAMSGSMDRSAAIGFRCAADTGRPKRCPWQLCAAPKLLEAGANIDLSRPAQAGGALAVDWAHFGLLSATDVQRRAGGGRTISIAGATAASVPREFIPLAFPGTPIVNSLWTDGEAGERAGATARGVMVSGVGAGSGLRLTFTPPPAAIGVRSMLVLTLGCYRGMARLHATLGGSAVHQQELGASVDGGARLWAVELELLPSDDWPLVVDWTLAEAFEETAHVSMLSATVAQLAMATKKRFSVLRR